jgi:hypothetical protein
MSAPASRRGFLRGLTTLPLIGGGLVASGLPTTAQAEPGPQPNPDAALIALDQECSFLAEELEAVRKIKGDAYRAAKRDIGITPLSLICDRDDRSLIRSWRRLRNGHAALFYWTYGLFEDMPEGCSGYAWRVAGLKAAVRHVGSDFGHAGMTPKRIGRWKRLLPEAQAYGDKITEARERHGYDTACKRYHEIEAALCEVRSRFCELPAVSAAGLAVHVRRFENMPVENMPDAWRALLFSAANICGIGAANVGYRRGA